MATVFAADDFDVEQDAEFLKKAMKGFGTDEEAIIAILASRSNCQRQEIKDQYKSSFGEELIKALKSELGGNFEDAIDALMMATDEFDAHILHSAISGAGTDEKPIIEVLASRTNDQINALKKAYQRVYEEELENDLENETSGTFKRLLISLVQATRDDEDEADEGQANEDAEDLKSSGEGTWGTDESRFNVILTGRSFTQLELIFQAYESISEKTLPEVIKTEFSGDVEVGLLAIVNCAHNRPAFFAEKLHDSMEGLGTDDETLIRIIVSRCEIDMELIKNSFEGLFHKSLAEHIKSECSGDYKKLLLKLIGE